MLGFKTHETAHRTIAGIELMHVLRKGQLEGGAAQGRAPAARFYALAAFPPAHHGYLRHRSTFATHPEEFSLLDREPFG
jgi:hypothetical protein